MAHAEAGSVMKGVHIRYKGLLDFDALWRMIGNWFESKGFIVLVNKAKHATSAFGEVLESEITAWRNVTDYYRFEMRVYHKYWDAQPVEVDRNGQKKTLLKARYHFMVSGKLIFDYDNRFDKSRWTQALQRFMESKVLKWQWDAIYGDQLNYKILELMNVIKEFINMEVTGSEYADMW